jgi:hypothetical protein
MGEGEAGEATGDQLTVSARQMTNLLLSPPDDKFTIARIFMHVGAYLTSVDWLE